MPKPDPQIHNCLLALNLNSMPVFQLTNEPVFPPPQMARKDGLLAVGGDLLPERLIRAYSLGIFPWYAPGEPILWWAPTPRLVLFPGEFKRSRRLERIIRQGTFKISMDQNFRQVIASCADTRLQKGEETWIDSEMLQAYCTLHELGFAHSVECWHNGILAGGLYGISLGTVFFGESMFSSKANSSKIALATLVDRMLAWNFEMIDCQIGTRHLMSLGAREIPGDEFYPRLARCMREPTRRGIWQIDDILRR